MPGANKIDRLVKRLRGEGRHNETIEAQKAHDVARASGATYQEAFLAAQEAVNDLAEPQLADRYNVSQP
jgi:hypothetical protein